MTTLRPLLLLQSLPTSLSKEDAWAGIEVKDSVEVRCCCWREKVPKLCEA